ncbi:MAG: T9SS type A sorting domain-containing protein [Bacteroidales bacterium]|nr:T9SS type A sorting domain-containing protein [Bacteroidales bacterium]
MKNIVINLLFLCLPILSVGQQTIYGSIIHDGLQRDYILYVPDSYTTGIPVPLVLNFHGYTSSANEQMWYGDFRSIADTAGFLIVHPMGTEDALGNTHWNVGWGGSTVDDIGFTESLIDSLASEYTIDIERVFSTGMSNGGFMSYALACELSHRIAAIASVTGTMNKDQPNSCNPQHPMPVMEIHGTADVVVPYYGADWIESIEEVLSYWANFSNCNPIPIVTDLPDIDPNDGSTVEHYLYTDGDSGVEVEHYKIINGGHTWPGSAFGGPGTNYDMDASVEIWRFFSAYDINGLISQTGVGQLRKDIAEATIYPNPANSFITIELKAVVQLDYELTTLVGKLLFSGSIHSQNHKLNITELPQGIYLLKAGNRTYKIVKAK